MAYEGMRTNQPLTITVEQAAQVLGIGRSTAYELVRGGDLACLRLGRRIVVPVAHLADRLGVEREAVWSALAATRSDETPRASKVVLSEPSTARPCGTTDDVVASLF